MCHLLTRAAFNITAVEIGHWIIGFERHQWLVVRDRSPVLVLRSLCVRACQPETISAALDACVLDCLENGDAAGS